MNEITEKIVANNFPEFLNAVARITRSFGNRMPWWRGHANHSWKLHPSLYHKKVSNNESNMSVQFRNQAKVRHANVPDINDGPSWVFLMQHYGLPTRLLDGSDSPLTALYFAVENNKYDRDDASVWGLMPTELNQKQVNQNWILGTGNLKVQQSFSNVWKRGADKTNAPEIIAINTQHVDVRQMVQASQFTIHGCDTGMEELPDAHEFICAITIPSVAKEHFRQVLGVFHVTESYLFPDLEHLAKQIQSVKYTGTDEIQ